MLSEKEAGKDVTLKEGKEFDFEAAEKEDEERAKREEEEGEDGSDRRRRYGGNFSKKLSDLCPLYLLELFV